MRMGTVLILTIATALTLAGDYCIKVASGDQDGLSSKTFMLGALLYAMPSVAWFFLMRSHSLAAVGVYYSAAVIILLATLGCLVFKEAFGLREVVGLSLAIASVVVMSREA
jgi:multidrug transporter EmrE-like cation transporter